jgi:tRNA splicing ligase
MYNDYVHARSVDGNSHWTQSWVRQFHSTIAYDIPENWRICGENMFAKHSIKYDNLKSYFYLFSIWNEKNECLSWDETTEWAELLGVETVPLLYRGTWTDSPELIHKHIWDKKVDETTNEGYVIRTADKFHYNAFKNNTAKYVRKNHVTSASHWKYDKIEQNDLIK